MPFLLSIGNLVPSPNIENWIYLSIVYIKNIFFYTKYWFLQLNYRYYYTNFIFLIHDTSLRLSQWKVYATTSSITMFMWIELRILLFTNKGFLVHKYYTIHVCYIILFTYFNYINWWIVTLFFFFWFHFPMKTGKM